MEGENIAEIIIVGRLVEVENAAMRTIFTINDNTGAMNVIFYGKGENETPTALKDF